MATSSGDREAEIAGAGIDRVGEAGVRAGCAGSARAVSQRWNSRVAVNRADEQEKRKEDAHERDAHAADLEARKGRPAASSGSPRPTCPRPEGRAARRRPERRLSSEAQHRAAKRLAPSTLIERSPLGGAMPSAWTRPARCAGRGWPDEGARRCRRPLPVIRSWPAMKRASATKPRSDGAEHERRRARRAAPSAKRGASATRARRAPVRAGTNGVRAMTEDEGGIGEAREERRDDAGGERQRQDADPCAQKVVERVDAGDRLHRKADRAPALASSRSKSRQRGRLGCSTARASAEMPTNIRNAKKDRLREALHLPVEQPQLVEPGIERRARRRSAGNAKASGRPTPPLAARSVQRRRRAASGVPRRERDEAPKISAEPA